METAFNVNAFRYLVKPVDVEKFSEVFNRAWKEVPAFQEQTKKYIIVKSSGVYHKLLLENIYYIESGNKKVIFHTTYGILEVYGKMEELENVSGNTFYQMHTINLLELRHKYKRAVINSI